MLLNENPQTVPGDSERAERRAGSWSTMLVAMGVCIVTVAAFSSAWVTEDAFISFRYVNNLWDGHGLVFNIGERVQGFTHPLWLFLLALVPGRATYEYSIALGLFFTAGAALLVGLAWRNRIKQAAGFVLASIILASSNSFRSYSTSGLENSLTHFLLAWLFYAALGRRNQRLSLWGVGFSTSLILLNRLDQLFLVAPLFLSCFLGRSSDYPWVTRIRLLAVTAMPLLA